MQTYLIERRFGPVTPEQVAAAGAASKRIAREQFADTIMWKHSYASQSADGLSTTCVYEATDEAAIRAHATAAGMPCDHITAVDTITPEDFA